MSAAKPRINPQTKTNKQQMLQIESILSDKILSNATYLWFDSFPIAFIVSLFISVYRSVFVFTSCTLFCSPVQDFHCFEMARCKNITIKIAIYFNYNWVLVWVQKLWNDVLLWVAVYVLTANCDVVYFGFGRLNVKVSRAASTKGNYMCLCACVCVCV